MAQLIRYAKKSLINDIITGAKTLASPVITAITGLTSLTALAATELTIVGSSTKDVEVTLGDAAGVTDFHVADSAGVELFKVPSTGVIALEGGATLDNSTSATTLTITETNVDVVGAFTANSVTSDAAVGGTVITASDHFVGDITGDVTGNADTATTATTALGIQIFTGAGILTATVAAAVGTSNPVFIYVDSSGGETYLGTYEDSTYSLVQMTATAAE